MINGRLAKGPSALLAEQADECCRGQRRPRELESQRWSEFKERAHCYTIRVRTKRHEGLRTKPGFRFPKWRVDANGGFTLKTANGVAHRIRGHRNRKRPNGSQVGHIG
jgi:hypothetical protein